MKFTQVADLKRLASGLKEHPKEGGPDEYFYSGALETAFMPTGGLRHQNQANPLKAPGHDIVDEMVNRYMNAAPLYYRVTKPPKVHDFT